jgi:hypothetical protein
LAWDEAGAISADASEVPAGVYVFWASDQSLHHYKMDYEQYVKHIKSNPTDPGVTAALPQGMTFVERGTEGPDGVTSGKHRFVITEDVEVVPSGSVKDLTIMPRAGAKEDLGQEALAGGEEMEWAINDFGITEDMDSGDIYDQMVASGSFLGNYNVGSPLHKILSSAADTANLNITSSGGHAGRIYAYTQHSGGNVSWNSSNFVLNNMAGQEAEVFGSLLTGDSSLELDGVVNPNLNVLEPTGVSGKYRFKEDALASLVLGSAGGSLSEIDLEAASGGAISAASEPLGPRDFEVTLAPKSEQGVRVVAPGDVRIAADVKGSGASISAQGDIHLVGVGFDLDAANGEAGTDVSLYSTRDINISTLRKQASDEYEFSGLDLRGVLYSWGNINLKMSHPDETGSAPQKVHIQGTMVAYGGEPGKDRPGKKGGDITIKADQIDLVFDPGYLLGVSGPGTYKVTLSPLSQAYRQ